VAFAVEAQFDPVVPVAVAKHAVGDAAVHEQVHGAVFQDARPDRFGYLLVAADLDDGGFDPRLGQQVGQHEAGRAGAHNGHLGSDELTWHGIPRFIAARHLEAAMVC
jgi:hypothetical protein